MAVIDEAVMISETADWSATGGYSIRRRYQVRADTAIEALANAKSKTGPGFPIQSASCQYADEKNSSTHRHVDIVYANPQNGQPQNDPDVSPLDWDVKHSYPLEEVEEEYFRDVDGLPLATSAGEPLDGTPPRFRSWFVIQVEETVAETAFDPADLYVLATTINAGAVTIDGVGYQPRTLLLSAPQASEKLTWTDGTTTVEYRKITYRLRYNPATWDHYLEDRGFKQLSAGKQVDIMDTSTPPQPVTKPYPLNGSGVAQASPTTAPAILTRKPYTANAWTGVF